MDLGASGRCLAIGAPDAGMSPRSRPVPKSFKINDLGETGGAAAWRRSAGGLARGAPAAEMWLRSRPILKSPRNIDLSETRRGPARGASAAEI